jgi:hypothetical protein
MHGFQYIPWSTGRARITAPLAENKEATVPLIFPQRVLSSKPVLAKSLNGEGCTRPRRWLTPSFSCQCRPTSSSTPFGWWFGPGNNSLLEQCCCGCSLLVLWLRPRTTTQSWYRSGCASRLNKKLSIKRKEILMIWSYWQNFNEMYYFYLNTWWQLGDE